MKTLQLDFANIKAPKDFYAALKKQLALPPHFGDNLDALYDFLSADYEGSLLFSWASYAADCKKNDALQAIGEVLYRVSLDRKDIKLDLRPPKK